jgi:hypothetical protein
MPLLSIAPRTLALHIPLNIAFDTFRVRALAPPTVLVTLPALLVAEHQMNESFVTCLGRRFADQEKCSTRYSIAASAPGELCLHMRLLFLKLIPPKPCFGARLPATTHVASSTRLRSVPRLRMCMHAWRLP